ncbi:MAG: hypothetical protein CMM06_15015 [Rhodopirellula sp.]|nr:hypothetical protein [Rhodopirellula sp.]|tara:strand:- start:37712 stop:39211 length:1500 start_codon:yes stop_codon:yes gene_type:complete
MMFNRMEKRISAGLSMWMLLWMLTVVVGQDTQLRQDYSSQEINEDLDRMYAILSSMHPGLHLYTTPKDLRRSFEQARVPVGESRSLRSVYMSFASIVDQVRCGHTYATVPTSAQTELTRDAVFFPLPLKFIEGRAYVNHRQVELPCGVEVLSVNGLAMQKLVPQLMPFVTADGFVSSYRYELLSDSFSMSLAIAFPQQGQFQIEYRKANGEVALQAVQGVVGEELKRRMRFVAYGKPPLLPYRIDRISDDTAFMAIDTFDNDYGAPPFRVYKSFLTKSFKLLEKNPEINNLILDLRLNEGGFTRNEMMLYSFLSDRPFREMQSGGATRNSIAFKEDLSRLYQTRGMIKGTERRLTRELEPLDASGFELSDSWIPRILPAERRFQGNLYVLTSGRTHSAAAAICTRLRESQMAIFIGEETGGVQEGFTAGTTLVYALPNTGIELAVPILKYSMLKQPPAEPGRGIKPDHRVLVRPEDLKSGEDRVLKFTTELIRRHSRSD